PVQPGNLIVLGIGIVVALLRAPEFITGRQHYGAARGEQGREQGADRARAPLENVGIVAGAFNAAIPGEILAMAVTIVFAIALVVALAIGDHVGKRESVMGRDEIHT